MYIDFVEKYFYAMQFCKFISKKAIQIYSVDEIINLIAQRKFEFFLVSLGEKN